MKAKITKRSVDAIDVGVGQSGTVKLWDTEIKGFGVRAYKSGRKVYVFKYRSEGQLSWETIGAHGAPHTPDSARERALELSYAVSRGENPGARRRAAKPSLTVSELIDLYLSEGPISKPNKRASSWATETSRLHRHVRPLLGRRPANKVVREEVEEMQRDIAAGKTAIVERTKKKRGKAIVEGGKGSAANAVVCLSSMYSWAVWKKIVPNNPCQGVEKISRKKRIHFFTPDEHARMLDALDTLESSKVIQTSHADALRLLMLTGARKMEILGLEWREVHMDRKMILLPSVRAKNGETRPIYLTQPMIDILDRCSRESDFVFPNPASRSGHIIDPKRAWKLVLKEAKIEPARIHDLRHNFASTAVGMGLSLRLTGALLGHRSAQSTEIYATVAQDPAREASERVSAELMRSRANAQIA